MLSENYINIFDRRKTPITIATQCKNFYPIGDDLCKGLLKSLIQTVRLSVKSPTCILSACAFRKKRKNSNSLFVTERLLHPKKVEGEGIAGQNSSFKGINYVYKSHCVVLIFLLLLLIQSAQCCSEDKHVRGPGRKESSKWRQSWMGNRIVKSSSSSQMNVMI